MRDCPVPTRGDVGDGTVSLNPGTKEFSPIRSTNLQFLSPPLRTPGTGWTSTPPMGVSPVSPVRLGRDYVCNDKQTSPCRRGTQGKVAVPRSRLPPPLPCVSVVRYTASAFRSGTLKNQVPEGRTSGTVLVAGVVRRRKSTRLPSPVPRYVWSLVRRTV